MKKREGEERKEGRRGRKEGERERGGKEGNSCQLLTNADTAPSCLKPIN